MSTTTSTLSLKRRNVAAPAMITRAGRATARERLMTDSSE